MEEFLKEIKKCRRQMIMAAFLKNLLFSTCIGVSSGIVIEMVSFVTPFYYAYVYAGLSVGIAVLTAGIITAVRRITMEQAALRMDRCGFDERIVTAYEQLSCEGEVIRLQREDAMRLLNAHRDRIKIPLLPSAKLLVLFTVLTAVLVVLMFIPSDTKKYAQELHAVHEEVKQKEKEVQEVIEELEELKEMGQGEMTPEQQEIIQDMIENLQSSMSEYKQSASMEMLSSVNNKLNYKYQNINSQLSSMAQGLKNGTAALTATAESMEAMSEKLREMSGQEYADAGGAGSGSQQGQIQIQQGAGSNGQNGQSGQNGNGQNGQSGQNGDGQNGQSGQNGNGQNGQSGQNGNGQNGQSGQNGNGENGNGQNGGQNGDGGENGNGRGTGTASTPHDYVSIPNDIAESGNLLGNSVNHDASGFFYTQGGLSWEGEHMSYDAVIGSYEQNAYEGIAAGNYPSGMEEIIKEYFSSFNN